MTNIIPIIEANFPASTESFPKPGPTERSSITVNGAGKAPALNKRDKSFVSETVNCPVIWPEEKICACITGALTTFPSKIIANGLPIFLAVTLSIGIITSMFTAIMVTRMLVVFYLRRNKPKKLVI